MKLPFLLLPFLFTIFTNISIQAQYCMPIGNCAFNDYIDSFEFGAISNLNSQGNNCGTMFNPSNAYVNTGLSTTVTQGIKTFMSISSANIRNKEQGFGIWIDFNKDQDFDDIGEFVWGSQTIGFNFTDSIYIPFSLDTGITRMRVRSTRASLITATQSCAIVNWGESEDYLVDIRPVSIPPLTDFSANVTLTCNGTIEFTDLTPNQVSSWLWEFGDGNTSTQQNPIHTYNTSGKYTVKLTCTNAFGVKQEVKTNYISYTANGLPNASCTPTTGSPNAGFGIMNFSFATINNTSTDGTIGFEDFSCIQGTATQGTIQTIMISANNAPANQNYRVWIDYNNDGVFSNSSELVLNEKDVKSSTKKITIPANTVLNKPLRVRVAGVYILTSPLAANFTACSNLNYGQMEDYGIIVLPNTSPPVAEFTAINKKSCNGKVQFEDQSTNTPTSWSWDFGDGNTSTLQNPLHTYTSSGTYNVKLKSSNSYGSNNISKTSFIVVDLSASVKSTCAPSTISHRDDYGINLVVFDSISNQTTDGSVSYEDYSCTHQVTIKEGKAYSIQIKTGTQNLEDVYVWIDYNNDGIFDPITEQVFSSAGNKIHSGQITVLTGQVLNKSIRMRIMSDIVGQNPTPCTDPTYGQVEDYGIVIVKNNSVTPLPTTDFSVDSNKTCTGFVNFTDLSTNTPIDWVWDFGDGNTSTQQTPTHQYLSYGTYTVKLTATNAGGIDIETKTAFIEFDEKFCSLDNSLEFNSIEQSFVFYPNPATDELSVRFPTSTVQKFEIAILSLHGQVLLLKSYNVDNEFETKINLSNYPTGVHFIQVKVDSHVFTKKIIIK